VADPGAATVPDSATAAEAEAAVETAPGAKGGPDTAAVADFGAATAPDSATAAEVEPAVNTDTCCGAGAGFEAALGSGAEAPSTETSSCSNTPVTESRQTSFPIKSLQTLELPQSARQIRFLNIKEEMINDVQLFIMFIN
jgi:hypothetical protein